MEFFQELQRVKGSKKSILESVFNKAIILYMQTVLFEVVMFEFIRADSNPDLTPIPLYSDRCQAGFPSPAQDYVEAELDLNQYCISRPSSTYFVRAIGNSMTDIGLHSGDLMIVDKAEQAQHGDIVIAEIEGEFTVKRLLLRPRPGLQAMNPAYPTLWPDPENLQIFGVVTAFVHKTRGHD